MPGLVPRDPGSPLTRKVVHWLKGGEWALLKLLLLTRQAAEHGAVEPRRNELSSFRARRGLSIVPIKSTTGPRLLLDSTALHCSAGCQPPPTTTQETVLGVGEVLVWCQKIAWVSPARPTLPSDSKSRAYGSYSHGETDLRLICTWTDRQSVRTIAVQGTD